MADVSAQVCDVTGGNLTTVETRDEGELGRHDVTNCGRGWVHQLLFFFNWKKKEENSIFFTFLSASSLNVHNVDYSVARTAELRRLSGV